MNMTMEEKLLLENFKLETNLINEQLQRETVELSQFQLETKLIDKGVI